MLQSRKQILAVWQLGITLENERKARPLPLLSQVLVNASELMVEVCILETTFLIQSLYKEAVVWAVAYPEVPS